MTVEVYTDPAAPEASAAFSGELVVTLLAFLAIGVMAGLIALAVFIAGMLCKRRGFDEDRKESAQVRTGLVSTAMAGVLTISSCGYASAQGHIDPANESSQDAREEYEAQIEENRQSTVEQFTDRYGEIAFLRCTGGQCREEDDLYEELAEEWTGGYTTRDVSFYDADGVLVEDAYLLRQDSVDPEVEFTVKLMVRTGADEAHEYEPRGDQ